MFLPPTDKTGCVLKLLKHDSLQFRTVKLISTNVFNHSKLPSNTFPQFENLENLWFTQSSYFLASANPTNQAQLFCNENKGFFLILTYFQPNAIALQYFKLVFFPTIFDKFVFINLLDIGRQVYSRNIFNKNNEYFIF